MADGGPWAFGAKGYGRAAPPSCLPPCSPGQKQQVAGEEGPARGERRRPGARGRGPRGTGRGSSYLGQLPAPPGKRARRGSRRPPPAPARSPTPLLPRAPSRLGPASRAQPEAPPALPPGRSGSPVPESRRSRAGAPQAGRADGRGAGSGTTAPWRGRGEAGAAAEGASGGGRLTARDSCPAPTPPQPVSLHEHKLREAAGVFGSEERAVRGGGSMCHCACP